MTLKEKFKNILFIYEIATEEAKIDRCEQIADDFTIEFAEWIDNLGYIRAPDLWVSLEDGMGKTSQELLEIYKEEKGL
jgi:hypothetical protein